MKTKNYIPQPQRDNNGKKSADYWGMLFVSFIFLSSISCFLFANNIDRQSSRSVSDSEKVISNPMVDLDQKSKS